MLAASTLRELGVPTSQRDADRKIVHAIDAVAERLGNTRAVCRSYYVHPLVLESCRAGATAPPPTAAPKRTQRRERPTAALRRDEVAVLQFLQDG